MLELDPPPHNELAERCVLASCLLFPERALAEAQKWVDAGSFYLTKHRELWLSMDEYQRAGNPPDLTCFLDFLANRSAIEECGGLSFLKEVIEPEGWNWGNIEFYARIVASHAERRGYIGAGHAIAREARNGDPDADLAGTAAALLRAVDRKDGGEDGAMHEALPDFANMDPERVFGPAIMSGVFSLDRDVRIGAEKYVIIGARPGHGKTALAMTIAVNAAMYQHLRVLFYSFEQKPLELKINALAQMTGVEAKKIHNGTVSEVEAKLLNGIKSSLNKMPLSFVNAKGWGLSRLLAHAEAQALSNPPALIVVDHVGIIDFSERRGRGAPENRQQQIAEASLGIKTLTGRAKCPVLLLCQLNRDVEKQGRRPQASDLRDSGTLEQDADIILFPFRPQAGSSNENPEADAEIIVAKNKNAKPGSVIVTYIPKTMKFEGRGM